MSEVRPLRAYAEVVLGRQRSPKDDVGPHMVRYLRAANVKDGYLDLDDVKEMNFSPDEQRAFALSPGDVLVTEGSGSLSAVGASSVWRGDLDGVICFQNTLLRLRPRVSTDPGFLAWWCRYAFADGLFAAAVTGANIYHLSAERLRALPVRYLPLETQRAIADHLDTETERIDALITKKQRMIELLQARWRAGAAHRLRELMNEHGAIQLRHLVRCLDGHRVPLSMEDRSARPGDFPYYGASGVVDHLDDYLFDETLVLLGEDGAQLGVPEFPVARVVAGKIWVNNHAHVLRPTAVDPDFLVSHLNTFDRVPFISGGTREKITQDDMRQIPVPHLTLSDQRKEAVRLGLMRSRSDKATGVLVRQVDLLHEHRQALITAAVTGELEIPGVAA